VIGEAAAQLDADVKERFPEIPWAQPARLRDRGHAQLRDGLAIAI
jgi:uncharacterized protein with HEPN domain